MKVNQCLIMAGIAASLCFSVNQGLAQGNQGRGNADPAQMRQRMMDRYKQVLEVNSDDEWNVIQPLVQKVTDARAAGGGMGRGMFGRGRGGGGAGGGGGGNQGDQGQRRRALGQPPSPEAEALQKAIENKAPKAEIKAALDKYTASRKAKRAELETAQENLRKVLTARQEAIATLNGLL